MKLFAPAHETRRSALARFFQFSGLSLTVFGLFVAAVIIHLTALYVAPTPHQLYHLTWEAVPQMIYDESELTNWDDWEHKFDDKIKTHEDAVKYANEMIKSIDDPYTRLHSPDEVKALTDQAAGEFAGVGLQFKYKLGLDKKPVMDPDGLPYPATDADGYPVIDQVIKGGPAEKAGLADGEALVSGDGESFKDVGMEKLIKTLKGKPGTDVTVIVRDTSGVERSVVITRDTVEIPTVTVKKYGKVGYIGLSGFIQNDALIEMRDAFKELEDSEALIFDLRGNGGGRLDFATAIAAMFIEEGDIIRFSTRVPGLGHENVITRLTKTSTQAVRVDDQGNETKVGEMSRQKDLSRGRPVVLLIDGGSASASEVVTGALLDNNRVTAVGTTTYGKGIGQSMIPFAGKTMLRITSFRFFSPKGTWAGDAHKNKHGFKPHHEIERADDFEVLSDTDNQLQFGLEHLNKVLAGK